MNTIAKLIFLLSFLIIGENLKAQAGNEDSPISCSDGIDNDGDGLVDCDDPECQSLANQGCATCMNDGLSFADFVIDFIPECTQTNITVDPVAALGVPDFADDPAKHVSLGEGGILKLGFNNNLVTNSGNGEPDIWVFEVGAAVEGSAIELQPFDANTENFLLTAGIPDSDADGYFEFGSIGGSTAFIDIDGVVPGHMPGALKFNAIKLIDIVESCDGSDTPGADIDAVCAISSISVEICDNNIDDDGDGLIDCYDIDCSCICEGETFRDNFDGNNLNPDWIVLSSNPDSEVGLTGEGSLRLKASGANGGSIIWAMTNAASQSAPRLYVPVSPDQDWTIETKVNFNPTNDAQGAGLLGLANPDSNERQIVRFADLGYQDFNGRGVQAFIFPQDVPIFQAPYSLPEVFLRVEKQGTSFTTSYSSDGLSWTVLGSHTYDNLAFHYVGLYAVRQPDDEMASVHSFATFDYFNVESCEENSGLTPFSCEPGFYQAIEGQLYEFDFSANTYTPIGPDYNNYNGLGYNTEDNLLYAIFEGSTELIQIDASGVINNLGPVTGLPNFSVAGAFDLNGHLFVYNNSDRKFSKIDVKAYPLTAEEIVLSNYPENSILDFAYNPVDGLFYAIQSESHVLFSINPVTGETNATALSGLSGTGYASIGSTEDGRMYVVSNNGNFYIVNVNSLQTTFLTTVNPNNHTDGASCVNAPIVPGILPCDFDINLMDGLMAYYSFDEHVLDASGNGNNGTIQGSPVYADGIQGASIRLDGLNDFVAVNNKLNLPESYTVSAWLKPESIGHTWQNVLAKYETNGFGPYAFSVKNNDKVNSWISTGDGGNTNFDSDTQINRGKWVHVVWQGEGTTGRIYINGQLDIERTIALMTQNNDLVTIGRQALSLGNNHGDFKGSIDELRIYGRILSQDEIAILSGNGPVCLKITMSAENLVCRGDSTGSISVSVDGGTPPYAYAWNSDLASGNNPNGLPAGTYIVTVTDANNNSGIGSISIEDGEAIAPVAGFNFSTNELEVTFSDISSGDPTTWEWTFGDGNRSDEQNPGHTYASPGLYEVCLQTGNNCGEDLFCNTIEVTSPTGPLTFTIDSVSGPAGTTIQIPVFVENFTDIAGFQKSIHLADPAIAQISGISGFNLPDLNIGNFFQVNESTLTVAWFSFNPPGVTVADGTPIFVLEVQLDGAPGTCTSIFCDGEPTDVLTSRYINNIPQEVPHILNVGKACVLPTLSISGSIETEIGEPVPEAGVHCTGIPPTLTNSNGDYTFDNLNYGGDFTIKPEKKINLLEEVNTFDVLLIMRHILNFTLLDSPYKRIAADIDHNESINIIDAIFLQQAVIGFRDEFPNNSSWRFVPADYIFPNPDNPFNPPFPDSIQLLNLMADSSGQDFIGIKIGNVSYDLNGFTGGTISRSQDIISLQLENRTVGRGEEFILEIKAKDFEEVSGFQFELNFISQALEVLEILPGTLPGFGANNIGNRELDKGILLVSCVHPNGEGLHMEEGQLIFKIKFKAKKEGQLKEWLSLRNDQLHAEAYREIGSNDYLLLNIALEIYEGPAIRKPGLHWKPRLGPNPASQDITLRYRVEEEGPVHIELFNHMGHPLKVILDNEKQERGLYTQPISLADLVPGTYYLHIRAGQLEWTEKIIRIKP